MTVYFSSVNKKVQIFSPQKNHQHGIELLFTIRNFFVLIYAHWLTNNNLYPLSNYLSGGVLMNIHLVA